MREKPRLKSIVTCAMTLFLSSACAFGGTYKAIDLTPSGFYGSKASGASGTQQVGYGYGSDTGGYHHALLWSGSEDSFIDLHQFLPTGFARSEAYGIDCYGKIVGYATDNSGDYHAILWQVPEPATLFLLGLGAVMLRRKR